MGSEEGAGLERLPHVKAEAPSLIAQSSSADLGCLLAPVSLDDSLLEKKKKKDSNPETDFLKSS